MKIKTVCAWDPREPEPVSDYVCRSLSGDDDGRIECLENGERRLRDAFGRLLEALAEKGHFSAPEIVAIVDGFNRSAAEFEA